MPGRHGRRWLKRQQACTGPDLALAGTGGQPAAHFLTMRGSAYKGVEGG